MSANGDSNENSANGSDSGPGRREVAYRLFAAEFEDAELDYAESEEERAPNYVVTSTGARVNRMFAVGVLTEVQPVGEDILRARIADPTGTFVVYAGQYQPDAQTFLERAEPPAYVAVTGKARTFQPEDSDVIYTSIRPESLNEVDEATRDHWTVQTARQTLERVGTMATAMQLNERGGDLETTLRERGISDGLSTGIPLALEHYGTTPGYLAAVRELAISAAEIVAGDREEAESLGLAPGEGGEANLAALAATAPLETGEAATGQSMTSGEETESVTPTEGDATATTDRETASVVEETASNESEPSDVESADVDTTVDSETGVAERDSVAPDDTTPSPRATADAEDEATEAIDETTQASESPAEESTDAAKTDETTGPGDFDGEFELDEAEREEIKAEFGTEFTTGTDVDEPGAADIETPEPESVEEVDTRASETASEAADGEHASTDESDRQPAKQDPEEGSDDAVDLEDAVMDAMIDFDDGDGADRQAVIESVVAEYGTSVEAVEAAIQDALMNGRCYEPGDGRLKPI